MIEVKLILHDAVEVGMIAQAMQVLEIKRQQDSARQFAQPLGDVPSEPTREAVEDAAEDAADLADMAAAETAGGAPVPWEQVKAEIAAAPAAAPIPSDIELARAITEYSQRVGVPKARELIESFGVKNTTSLPDERRAEFIAKTAAQ